MTDDFGVVVTGFKTLETRRHGHVRGQERWEHTRGHTTRTLSIRVKHKGIRKPD